MPVWYKGGRYFCKELVMGASGWTYFTDWNQDAGEALTALREEEFQAGRYGQALVWEKIAIQAGGAGETDPAFAAKMKATAARMRELEQQRMGGRKPRTAAEAVEMAEESGTHSILDIVNGVSADTWQADEDWEAGFGKAFAAPVEWLMKAFGTVRPTRKQVEEEGLEGAEALERWQCVYFAVWEEGTEKAGPRWWCFEGCSGD
jgi:hypothetical protein